MKSRPAGPPLPGKHPDDIHEPNGVRRFVRMSIPAEVVQADAEWHAGRLLGHGMFDYYVYHLHLSRQRAEEMVAWHAAYIADHGPHYAQSPIPVWVESQRHRSAWMA